MRDVEKEMWQMMKEVMIMTFEGREQREIMELLGVEDQLRTEDGVSNLWPFIMTFEEREQCEVIKE